MNDIIVESTRDERTLKWLVDQVGEERVAEACRRLRGRRRPFPSNLAKELGLKPPSALALARPEEARAHIAAIAELLWVRKCT